MIRLRGFNAIGAEPAKRAYANRLARWELRVVQLEVCVANDLGDPLAGVDRVSEWARWKVD